MMSLNDVYLRHLWYDCSTDRELITYTGAGSTALAAALPIFAQFVGSQIWNIVRLAIWHFCWGRETGRLLCQHRRPDRISKACAAQRMTIIRNADGGLSLCTDLIKHWWDWRRFYRHADGQHPRHVCRPFMLTTIGLVHFAG